MCETALVAVGQAIPAVIATDARFDKASAISLAAPRQRQLRVAGMGPPHLDRRGKHSRPLFTGTHGRTVRLRPPMSGDRVPYQRAQLLFSHNNR